MHIHHSLLLIGILSSTAALAYDNGPQVIGCDYRLGKEESTGQCLIAGSGTNQGISWLVFEVKNKRFRYTSAHENLIEQIDKSGETLAKYAVSNSEAPCRPGGKTADIYKFQNGNYVCLYW